MINFEIHSALVQHIRDPKDPSGNFLLGFQYESIGQTASAVSYYVRTTEFGNDDLLTYEALLRIALCFEKQGSRVFLTKGILHRAVSMMPNRPEAYFLLSRLYERVKDWQEAYSWAVVGEDKFQYDEEYRGMITDVQYPGYYGFMFERAVSAWWVGLFEESIYLFKQLDKNPALGMLYSNSVKSNLRNLWNTWKNPLLYDETMYKRLRYKFRGAEMIHQNHSQACQDMFVLTMLDGKRNGTFLEIGCADPFFGSNTALLEKQFGWTGISVDMNKELTDRWVGQRTATVICQDATTIKYDKLHKGDYDYLQIDCDPAIVTLTVLKLIPFHNHRFAVITFEHDFYNGDNPLVR